MSQYTINKYLDFSVSDCTCKYFMNFRSKMILQSVDTYSNLKYYPV